MSLPHKVKIVEVGPRDGLQNEKAILPTDIKLQFIQQLIDAGISSLEATSFVSPKWIPQMADQREVTIKLPNNSPTEFSFLVPNMKGFETALELGVRNIAIFTAASNTFCQKNINCTITESLANFKSIAARATKENIKIRGYISCIAGCPYEGQIDPNVVVDVAKALHDLGCYEISLGDTIGVGTAEQIKHIIEKVAAEINLSQLAGHYHNTYGQALANIYASLEVGVAIFDSSVSGLGGCPYAKGASGNVATEDVIYLLNGLNITTGIDLNKLVQAGQFIDSHLNRESQSNVAKVLRKDHGATLT